MWASLGVELVRFWHHHAKIRRERLTSRGPLERGVSVEAEIPSARELTRLVEECSAPVKKKQAKKRSKSSQVEDRYRRPRWKIRHRTHRLGSVFRRESLGNEEDQFCESFCCTGPNRFNAGCSSETEGTAHAPRLSFSCHWVFLHSKRVHF